MARALPIPERPPGSLRDASLQFAHLEGIRPFTAIAREVGTALPPGPYPEDRAAIHHLLDRGWMYVLPFDDGLCSVGLVGAGRSDFAGGTGFASGQAIGRLANLLANPTLASNS